MSAETIFRIFLWTFYAGFWGFLVYVISPKHPARLVWLAKAWGSCCECGSCERRRVHEPGFYFVQWECPDSSESSLKIAATREIVIQNDDSRLTEAKPSQELQTATAGDVSYN